VTTQNVAFARQNSLSPQSIPERFEAIAARQPDRLAVKFDKLSLSYRELNEASNRIAHALLAFEYSERTPVALLFGRGINVIVALIGTLKAGKQVQTLDPHAPEQRLKSLLDDCRSFLIVTDGEFLTLAQRVAGDLRTVLDIAKIDASTASSNLSLPIAPKQVATISYTSGSSGQPRGVVRTHERSVSAAISSGNYRNICAEDRVSLLHSITFSTGEADLWIGLLNGAAIFPFDFTSAGGLGLANWLRDERVTILHSPPAAFRELAHVDFDAGQFRNLRRIRLSGAPITREDFDVYRSKFGRGTLLEVGMGSTEIGSICNAVVDHDFSFPQEGSPAGYAREGREILILDDDGHKLGDGEVGEIAVRSRQFTAEYCQQLSLPEEKFRCDSKVADVRIYLTGDLGTRLPDGFVIHRGRKDLMVKIRGYRVDISEVEHALLEHPGIKEAGVRAWDREEAEKYLAGYIVLRPESVLNASEVREFLSNRLPDYMIPTALKFVEALPLTNGKLDRLALPKLDTRRPELKETYVAPRNEVERKLAGIWSEVLQIDNIGVHDNFFDLGGHSLTASRVLSRVLDCFRVEVSMRSFFESPTLTGLALNVENALLQGPSKTNLPLVRAPRDSHLPASFGQRALWFHDQLEPESCAYNLGFSYRFSGELDVSLLERSINEIVGRHEVLRTVFEAANGQPVQNILPVMTIGLEVIDLSNLASKSLQDSEVRRFARVLAEQSFDLTRGPLLRSALLGLASNEYVFLLAIHHIVFDGWSIGVFFRELSQIYNSLRSGKPCPFPELRIQYADFAMWQRERLRDGNLENSLSYWKNQLDNLPRLMLPIMRVQHSPERASGGREEFEVSDELLDLLRSLANRSGTTLFMVLLAAWKVALYRYTGQTDIAIGTPVAGRNHPAVEELIGYFLNLVVLRSDLSGDPTFRELLERIRRVCIDAFAYQDLPFEKLVEELRPTRHVTMNPLVQATFALQNTPKQSLNLTGIAVRDLDISAGVARPFDLHLYIVEEETCLRGYVSYNKNLIETDTIKRLINHLTNLLKAFVSDQDERISALPMLTEQERHQILVGWNDTEAEYPRDKCISELFEIQAEKTPDAAAVVFEDQQLSYQELNERANQVAHYLKKQGIGPEALVAIWMERSIEMIVALLAILKAGGAYVPLDPDYPQERLVFMLEDSRACLLLTQKSLVEDGRWTIENGDSRSSIPSTLLTTGLDSRLKVVCLGREWETIACESRENLSSGVTAENLAYVIYTSGSTGRPKGVAIEHHSTVALLSWAQTVFSAEEMAGVLASTSICFDLSVFELFGPLTSGGQVILAADAIALPGLVAASRVTLINTVPSAITELLRAKAIPSSVCTICLAGEPLTTGLVKDLYEQTSATKVYDLYGPSEDTTYSIFALRTKAGPQTVGRPISNTEVFILDRQRQSVPIGVCGGLYIGGVGLARGYLNRPELTAEKFIPNPFSDEPGARLYRTGDLARYLPDGKIEFLGRIDHQVKIRGYRIELGEIEAVLSQQPAVLEAVVVAQNNALDKRLVAYVVHRPGADISANELRGFLKQKLPDYMIPSAFVVLDALPLTPNGKADRKALPAPDHSPRKMEESYQAPRTPAEEMLVEIWTEILKLERIGIHDNFFDLGGHSLLATQVISRVRTAFQTEVALRTLFEMPTIAEFANAIVTERAATLDDGALAGIFKEIEGRSDAEAELEIAERHN
jgi:amino acid adenylation domain-containing protein